VLVRRAIAETGGMHPFLSIRGDKSLMQQRIDITVNYNIRHLDIQGHG